MMTETKMLGVATAFAFSLIAVGCSGEEYQDLTQMGEHNDGHDHDAPIEVGSDMAPSVSIEAIEDGHTFNLKLSLENFIFAPEKASTEHIAGEGHAHLYVDDVKVTRLYGPWFHLSGLSEGEHSVRVELSANSHNALAVNGALVDDQVTVDVPAQMAGHGMHDHLMVTAVPIPSIQLTVESDPKSGWNVRAVPNDFLLTPENVSRDHVPGEGHMHLYVGDEKIGRMYGEWFYIGALPLGENEIRVELSSNDHRTFMAEGAPIADSVRVEVNEDDSHVHGGHGGASDGHH